MLNVVIVDDEILAVDLLVHILKEVEGVEVVGAFTNESDALVAIQELEPDIIFLDIDMPEISGIQMAENIHAFGIFADIVYVTAYEHYAIKAFEVNAVDYIMKPTDKNRIIKTIQTITKRRNRPPLMLDSNHAAIQRGLSATMMGDFVLHTAMGESVRWRTKKVKEFCAYLLHHEHPVHRLQVIEDLWPFISMQKATALLYSTVYQLRKVFNEQNLLNAISFVDERFALLVEVKTDVHEIRQMLGETGLDRLSILKLLELVEKEYLEKEDYLWSVSQNEKLRADCRRFMESCLLPDPESDTANEIHELCLKKLLQWDPLNEQYGIRLIRYYRGLGDYTKAKEVYLTFKEAEWSELGIDMLSEIDRVFEALT